jgi:hypothetical protein
MRLLPEIVGKPHEKLPVKNRNRKTALQWHVAGKFILLPKISKIGTDRLVKRV